MAVSALKTMRRAQFHDGEIMSTIRRAFLVCVPAMLLVGTMGAPALAAPLRPPTGVSVTAESGTQARVTWLAASTATGYDVLRANAPNGSYAVLGSTTTLSYLDPTIAPGTSYSYVVRSRNGHKVSGNSSPALLPATLPPAADLRHTAYPDRVELGWAPVVGATRYEVRRGALDGSGEVVVGSTSQTSFTDPTVSSATFYTYWISATDGIAGSRSRPLQVYTGQPTAVTLRVTPSPSETGQTVLLVASVTTASGAAARGGEVRFYRDEEWIGTRSVNGYGDGLAERQWAAEGGHITADYLGETSGGLGSSGSAPVDHTVVPQVAEPASFTWPQHFEYGLDSWPVATAVADVTGDGRGDALMTTQQFGTESPDTDFRLWVFAQQPDGSLGQPQALPTNGGPAATMRIATGDVDGDGDADVAVTTRTGVDIFFSGGGQLAGPVAVPVEGGGDIHTGDVRLADTNGDGRADLVAASLTRIVVIAANADRTFQPPVLVAPVVSKQIEVGDVTGDGRPDVISREGRWTVAVYAQAADGGYAQSWRKDQAGDGWNDVNAIAVADATGDGRDDLAVTAGGNKPTSRMQVYAQAPTGGFAEPVLYPTHDIPSAIVLHDLDGDQRRDAIILHAGWATVSVMGQRPDGRLGADYFSSISASGSTEHRAMSIGDVTGDGKPDAILADYNDGLILLPLL